jgi:hypothetical protein
MLVIGGVELEGWIKRGRNRVARLEKTVITENACSTAGNQRRADTKIIIEICRQQCSDCDPVRPPLPIRRLNDA